MEDGAKAVHHVPIANMALAIKHLVCDNESIDTIQENFNINDKIKYHSGKCDCSSPNWNGELCDECAPKFFGPLCLPLVRLFSIFPTSGPDVGGTEIYVLGNNLPNVPTYICRFD